MAAEPGVPTRGLVMQWLQSLRVLTEAGDQTLQRRLALIAEMGGAGIPAIAAPDPPRPDDVDRLTQAVAATNRLRGLEHAAHALVTALLLHWLSEATGQSEADILAHLEETIHNMTYPHAHAPVTDPG